MKRYIKFIVCVVILLLGLITVSQNQFSLHLFFWGTSLPDRHFVLQKSYSQHEGSALLQDSLVGTSGTDTIYVTRSKTGNNAKFVSDKKFLLTSLFEPVTSSYPGVITNIISCPDIYKPAEEKVSNGYVYTLYAGERFNYGICSKDLIVYQSAYGIFDCKDKGAFEVMYFTKKSQQEAKSLVESFSC